MLQYSPSFPSSLRLDSHQRLGCQNPSETGHLLRSSHNPVSCNGSQAQNSMRSPPQDAIPHDGHGLAPLGVGPKNADIREQSHAIFLADVSTCDLSENSIDICIEIPDAIPPLRYRPQKPATFARWPQNRLGLLRATISTRCQGRRPKTQPFELGCGKFGSLHRTPEPRRGMAQPTRFSNQFPHLLLMILKLSLKKRRQF
ncbi:MAG: hypothetical protein M2R45_01530 [Verrucomicrobia subdivision 3 bacterium]|nr:hypothetical protein [Limisphaerales bacterium]MCS1413342.1 hypothetical protein [Limisphaerales bacterium]